MILNNLLINKSNFYFKKDNMQQTDFQNNLYNYYRISYVSVKSLFNIYNKNIFLCKRTYY